MSAIIIIICASAIFQFRQLGERLLRDFFSPFLTVQEVSKAYLSDKTLLLRNKLSLAREIEQLRRENQRLATQVAASADLKIANEQLRSALQLEQVTGWNYIFARPLLRNPLNWQERFIINKGSESGISAGALALTFAVIKGKTVPVVIGRVDNVSRHTAAINTLTNRATNLTVFIPHVNTVGFTVGCRKSSSARQVDITYLPRDKVYPLQSPVFTAGFNPAIPGGILVGYLEEINKEPGNSLYCSGSIRPVANLAAVNLIMIMVRDR